MTLVSPEDGQIRPCSQLVTWNYRSLGAGHHFCVAFLCPVSGKPTEQCHLHCAYEFGGGSGPERSQKKERGPLKESISYLFSE